MYRRIADFYFEDYALDILLSCRAPRHLKRPAAYAASIATTYGGDSAQRQAECHLIMRDVAAIAAARRSTINKSMLFWHDARMTPR